MDRKTYSWRRDVHLYRHPICVAVTSNVPSNEAMAAQPVYQPAL